MISLSLLRLFLVALAAWAGLVDRPQALANQVLGLQAPYSFLADPGDEQYFISNMHGEAGTRDNNGFITRLDSAGKITALHFIQGGQRDVTLHAPKGMAMIGTTLYVADIDTLRGFDKTTGKPLIAVSFSAFRRDGQAVSLMDVAADDHGQLYVSDTDANAIYRVDTTKQHTVSLLLKDPALAGPRGLAVHPKTGNLVVSSWQKGKLYEVTTNGALRELVSNGFFSRRFSNLDGLDFDNYGNLYLADFTAGKVWRMRPEGKFDVIAEFLPAPSDIGVDRRNHLILVPYAFGDAAEMNGLERPTAPGERKKRDLSDYGMQWLKKETPSQ